MKKTLLLAFLAFLLCGTAMAQKGEKSVSGGVVASFPTSYSGHAPYVKTGVGAELNGVSKFTARSAVQLQAGLTDFRNKHFPEHWTIFSLKVGYRYQLGASGIYLSGLVGPEFDMNIGDPMLSFTAGAGKRFIFKKNRFIDLGIDRVVGDTEPRVNLKLAYGFSWPRRR